MKNNLKIKIKPTSKSKSRPESEMNIDKIVGSNLRAVRTACGISQKDLGRKLGITFQQIQKYEQGANRLSCSKVYRLSKFFDIPIAEFFEFCDSSNPFSKGENARQTKALKKFNMLTKSQQDHINNVMNFFLKEKKEDSG